MVKPRAALGSLDFSSNVPPAVAQTTLQPATIVTQPQSIPQPSPAPSVVASSGSSSSYSFVPSVSTQARKVTKRRARGKKKVRAKKKRTAKKTRRTKKRKK